jgi:cytochrome b
MKMTNEVLKKPVWDIAIRLFHWTLVLSFIICYLTGEEESLIHVYTGYLIMALICFRIIWGFIGTQHARFADFIYSPRHIFTYAKGMLKGNVEHVEGHNPLGGLMIFALLICLTMTTVSGLKVYGLEGYGPLAMSSSSWFISEANASSPYGDDDYGDKEHEEDFWEEIHDFFANFTVFLIVLHVGGVVVSSHLEKQNLVKAMLTGYKQ